jgi:uncharacterized OsmC-like protein
MDLITVRRERGLEFKIQVRGHEFRSDMSNGDGGLDAAPSPAELLAGSLGACIAMMVQGYCDTHGYNDGEVGVSLVVEFGSDPKRVAGIVVDVTVPESVPLEKRAAVARVAELCTIHETLRDPPRIDIDITQ